MLLRIGGAWIELMATGAQLSEEMVRAQLSAGRLARVPVPVEPSASMGVSADFEPQGVEKEDAVVAGDVGDDDDWEGWADG